MGEALHGDYNMIMNEEMLHSVTNYECYKGLHSSFNSKNLFEIAYSLNRQFGAEYWTLYKNKHLYAFVDNHDVSRIASELKNEKFLPTLYALLFTMPGIPSVYYGSEWGVLGEKKQGDAALRPSLELEKDTSLTRKIRELANMRKQSKVLQYGGYKNLHVAGEQLVFERTFEGERITVGINIADVACKVHCDDKDINIPAHGFVILTTESE